MRIYSNKAARHNAMTLIVVYTRRFATNSFNFAVLILKLLFSGRPLQQAPWDSK